MKIPVSHGHLEAAIREPRGELSGGAVFCHPHPLQGGTMNTKAVYRAAEALNQVGFRALRFNFRGVGCSTGSFDDGIGEQDDLRAALDWLELGMRDGPLVAGGMSFGSMVAVSVGMGDPRVKALVVIGIPIHVYDYSFLATAPQPVLVVQGEHDEFGPAAEVREVLGDLGEHITIRDVPGAGHLFRENTGDLQDRIQEFFLGGPGASVFAGGEVRRGEVRL